ncbi:MAG: hypothetical protein I8H71_15185 [Xanthomonadaceae bacterium]|nr:hypothetical protein [Xanthomonadaceae bacterium]
MTARWRQWFLVSLGLLLGLATLHARAQELRMERAMFEDPSGDMTLAQVRQAGFSSAGKVVSLGYTRSALWMKLTVDAPNDAPTLVLRVVPASLDEVTLFSPGAADTGQRLRGRSTLIQARPGKSGYYLRVKTSGALLVSASLLTMAQAQQQDIKQAMVLGAVLACCFPVIIGMMILIGMHREPLHVLFLLNFCVSLAIFFGWFDYLGAFFGPHDWIASSATIHFLGIANTFTAFLFFRALFNRFGLPRWSRLVFAVFFALNAWLFLLFFLLDRQVVLILSSLLGIFASAFCMLLAAGVFNRKKPATWFISALIFIAMALLLRFLLTAQGIVAPDASIMDMLAYRIFFLAAFFVSIFILLDRDKKSLVQMSLLNETVARRLADSEKNRRELQERFMTMLMHELKTPLAIIQLAATSLGRHMLPGSGDAARIMNINRSVDDLNTLIERCAQADQIDQGAAAIDRQLFSLKALADDVLHTVGAGRIRLVMPQAVEIRSDYHDVRLILLNLLSNALKYSPPDSLVELNIQTTRIKDAAGVRFSVLNGVGAAGRPDPAQVFVRYYRAEAARGQVGAGLGLWLAQAVARQLGSELHFQPAQAQVIFSFCLELA